MRIEHFLVPKRGKKICGNYDRSFHIIFVININFRIFPQKFKQKHAEYPQKIFRLLGTKKLCGIFAKKFRNPHSAF
jgi:hypothetical protein